MKHRLMKLLDVIFYNYYSIYQKFFRDIAPETSTVIGIWAFLTIGIIGFLAGILAYMGKIIMMISIFMVGFASYYMLYSYFIKTQRWKKIIKDKPTIKSKRFSVIITLVFTIVGILIDFGGPLLAIYICTGSI